MLREKNHQQRLVEKAFTKADLYILCIETDMSSSATIEAVSGIMGEIKGHSISLPVEIECNE